MADNPIVQTRAFGDDPNRVASLVRTWIEGCQDAGALACANRGMQATDSEFVLLINPDAEVVVLGADSRSDLEKTHARYFKNLRELAAAS